MLFHRLIQCWVPAMALAGCFGMPADFSFPRGEFPVLLEKSAGKTWLLTESYDATKDSPTRRVKLYALDASATPPASLIHTWSTPPATSSYTDSLTAAFEPSQDDGPPSIWILGLGDGYSSWFLYHLDVTRPAEKMPVPIDMMLGYPAHAHRLRILTPWKGVKWLYFAESRVNWPPYGQGLPLIEIKENVASVIYDHVTGVDCTDQACKMLRVGSELTFYETAVSDPAWKIEHTLPLPPLTYPYAPGMNVSCPREDGRQELILPGTFVEWNPADASATTITPLANDLEKAEGEAGYLLCTPQKSKALFFDLQRKLWAVDFKSGGMQRISGHFGKMPYVAALKNNMPDLRTEGFVMRSLDLNDGGSLLAFGSMTGEKTQEGCVDYAGPLGTCHIHTFRTRVVTLSPTLQVESEFWVEAK